MSATFAEFTTDDVTACECGDYWGRQVLQRMTITGPGQGRDFTARLPRLCGAMGDFWDRISDEIMVARHGIRCRRHGGDEICVGMPLDGVSDVSQAGCVLPRPGMTELLASHLRLLAFGRRRSALSRSKRVSAVVKERFAMRPQQLRDEIRGGSFGHARPRSR